MFGNTHYKYDSKTVDEVEYQLFEMSAFNRMKVLDMWKEHDRSVLADGEKHQDAGTMFSSSLEVNAALIAGAMEKAYPDKTFDEIHAEVMLMPQRVVDLLYPVAAKVSGFGDGGGSDARDDEEKSETETKTESENEGDETPVK